MYERLCRVPHRLAMGADALWMYIALLTQSKYICQYARIGAKNSRVPALRRSVEPQGHMHACRAVHKRAYHGIKLLAYHVKAIYYNVP